MSFDFTQTKNTLEEAVSWLQKEFSQISTGRANPALLDSIAIEVYGSMQPVKNIASISLEDARTLRISPWEKSQVKDIEKAIIDSKLPVSLAIDAAGLRASIPQMTEETRRDVVKLTKEKLEQARVRVRTERERTMKLIDTEGQSDDEKRDLKDDLQKTIDTYNEKLQEVFSAKEKDIMSV